MLVITSGEVTSGKRLALPQLGWRGTARCSGDPYKQCLQPHEPVTRILMATLDTIGEENKQQKKQSFWFILNIEFDADIEA